MGVADMQAMLQTRLNIESRVGQLMGPPSYIYPNKPSFRTSFCAARTLNHILDQGETTPRYLSDCV